MTTEFQSHTHLKISVSHWIFNFFHSLFFN